jgi:hypothetical protein
MKNATTAKSSRSAAPLRFAHPFFTTTPVARRKAVPGVGTSLIDHIEGNLQKVPAVKGKSVMQLADVIGVQASQEIQASGAILSFGWRYRQEREFSTGRRGRGHGDGLRHVETDRVARFFLPPG